MPTVTRQTPTASKKAGVLGRIKPLTEATCGLKCCIYGRSGTGKTTLVSTFPQPMLLIRSPAEFKRKSVYIKGADVVDARSMEELNEVAAHQLNSDQYKTVALDNLTDFQDMALKEVLGVDEVPAQLGWGVATQQQYGEVALYMKEMMRNYVQKLDCNVILLAQEREFNVENASDIIAPYVNAGLSPSIAGWIGPACDYLVQTFLRETYVEETKMAGGTKLVTKKPKVEFCLRVGPHPVYSTKFTVTRGTELPDVIVNPSYAKIMKLIAGEKIA